MKTVCLLALTAFVFHTMPSANAADWPRWRGPDWNGISTEKGWSTTWPKEGPKQLWKANVGIGFSSVSVANGRVFTLGNRNDQDTVYCFDAASGREVWKHSYGEPLDPKYYEGGPSSTPTVDGDRVFTFSRAGRVICFDAATGKILWQKNVAEELRLDTGRGDYWGFAGSPLVEGDLLILNAGTSGTALDKATGKVVWNNGKDACGYATPVPFTQDGRRSIAIFAAKAVVAVDAKNGQERWSFPWKTAYDVNAADPIFSGDKMFISSGYRTGGALVRLGGSQPTTVWKSQEMHNQMSPCVLIDGHLYGCNGQNGKAGDLRCVELATGTVKWKEPSAGLGAVSAADGKLIVLGEKGELIIAEAAPAAFKPLARAQVTGGKCWTVPVLSNGRIYCRNAKGDLVCVDVSGKATANND